MAYLRTLLNAARERLDSPMGRFLLLLSCVLVFSFAFHAKVAIYHHPGHVDGSTASKMWPTSGKIESAVSGAELTVFWLFAFLLLVVCAPTQRRYAIMRRSPVRLANQESHSGRFQRPPPQQ